MCHHKALEACKGYFEKTWYLCVWKFLCFVESGGGDSHEDFWLWSSQKNVFAWEEISKALVGVCVFENFGMCKEGIIFWAGNNVLSHSAQNLRRGDPLVGTFKSSAWKLLLEKLKYRKEVVLPFFRSSVKKWNLQRGEKTTSCPRVGHFCQKPPSTSSCNCDSNSRAIVYIEIPTKVRSNFSALLSY